MSSQRIHSGMARATASLSTSLLPRTDTQQDPWYFGVEEVIKGLIGPPGIIPHALLPDLTGLSNLIRNEHIVGQVLLTGINDTNLCDIMGVKALGERIIILNAIVKLRARSAEYKRHRQDVLTSSVVEGLASAPNMRRAVLASSTEGPVSTPNIRRAARRIAPTPITGANNDFAEAFREDAKWDDLLKRYTPRQGEADKLLPCYGESGSEGEYDTDDIKDMAPEDLVALQHPVNPINQSENQNLPSRNLSKEEILATIEKVNTQIIDKWRLKILPGLESKALRVWTRSECNNDRQNQLERSSCEIVYLESRLVYLQEEVAGQGWTNIKDLERLCLCTEQTVEDLEKHRWKGNLFRQTSPPGTNPATENSANDHRLNNVVDLIDSSEDDSEDINSFTEECMTKSLDAAPTSSLQRADEHLRIPSSQVTSTLGVKDKQGTSSPEVLDMSALSDASESPESSNEPIEVVDLTALSDASESPETSNVFTASSDLAAPPNAFETP